MSAIIYILPNTTTPTGGVTMMLDHVEALNRFGFKSFAVAAPEFKPWHKTTAKISQNPDRIWSCPQGSIIVVPEVANKNFLRNFDRRSDVIRVVFCQSYRGISDEIRVLHNHKECKIDSVFTNSPMVSEEVEIYTGFRAPPIVSCCVRSERFRRGAKRLAIAFMPKKLPHAQAEISNRLGNISDQVEWIPIENLNQAQTAEVLSESAVFLSLGYREGFGLPPLEAMASECIVVGFHAKGAKAYANQQNGFWHDEDDYDGCAEDLKAALELCRKGGNDYESRIVAGLKTVHAYSIDRMERELIGYHASIINKNNRSLKDFMV